jgi:hypothetical protein
MPTNDTANEILMGELRKDNRELRRLLDATATSVEHLLRENKALGAGQPKRPSGTQPPALRTIHADPVEA